MALPHHRFILYLISRRETDVGGVLDAYDLPGPVDGMAEIERLQLQLQPFPAEWTKSLLKSHIRMRRWLGRAGLLPLWEKPALVRDCLTLLKKPLAREALEIGILRGTSYGELAETVTSLSDRLVTEDLVDLFESAFFDVGMVGPKDWTQYLWRRPNPIVREEVEALKDSKSRKRAEGYTEENDISTLNEIVRLATRKMRDLSMEPSSAAAAIAMAQLAKVSTEAIEKKNTLREKMADVGSDDDILAQWHEQFELAIVREVAGITSLAELEAEPMKAIGVSND